jgi:hypothetical protein
MNLKKGDAAGQTRKIAVHLQSLFLLKICFKDSSTVWHRICFLISFTVRIKLTIYGSAT